MTDTGTDQGARWRRPSSATRHATRLPPGFRSCGGHPRESPRPENGIPADAESPIVVNGGMHGLFAAFATLLDPGDEALDVLSLLDTALDLVRLPGGRLLVPTAAARRDGLAATLAKRTTPKTQAPLLELAEQPDRRVFSRAEIEEAAAFVRERGLAVVSDEAYEDLSTRARGRSPSLRCRGCSSGRSPVFTLSKSYSMTGWRIGYVIAPEAIPVPDPDGRPLLDQRRLDADPVGRP